MNKQLCFHSLSDIAFNLLDKVLIILFFFTGGTLLRYLQEGSTETTKMD